MAFSFFFALFPGLIFTTTIFSYLPFEKIEVLLQQELGALLPQPVYQLIHDVVFEDIYKRRNITFSLHLAFSGALFKVGRGCSRFLRAFYQEGLPQGKILGALAEKPLGSFIFSGAGAGIGGGLCAASG